MGVVAADGGMRLVGDLPPGVVAFADHSWAGATILCGRLHRQGPGVEGVVAGQVVATAQAALAAASPYGEAEVVGDGVLAATLRLLLKLPTDGSTPPEDRVAPVGTGVGMAEGLAGDDRGPAVVIDASGCPAAIAAALERVPRRGAVFLASPPAEHRVDLRTYRDLHARSLTMAGIPWVGGPAATVAPAWLVSFVLGHLVYAPAGGAGPKGLWYAVLPP